MLKSIITRIVECCTRHPWPVIGIGLLLTLASALYMARHFAITRDRLCRWRVGQPQHVGAHLVQRA